MLKFHWVAGFLILTLFGACAEPEPEEEVLVIVAFDDSTGQQTPIDGSPGGSPTGQPNTDGDPQTDPDREPQPDPEDIVDPSGLPNHGWIGGACNAASDCTYDGSICQPNAPSGGQCSRACNGLCPDRDGENSVTFCINDAGTGRCVPQCDAGLYGGNGCREGYECRNRQRFGDAESTASVCVPPGAPADPQPEPEPEPELPCLEQLDQLGVSYEAWSYTTEYADGLACTINDPIYLTGPVNGVTYRYYTQASAGDIAVSCDLALALYELGDVFAAHNIVEVEHMGTFNCRKIGGTNDLSMHGLGLAIDFYGFIDSNGQDYVVERDWEHDTNSPSTTKGQLLYDLAVAMYNEQLFGYILTPNFNDAHDNHIHVDLTPGGFYIAYFSSGVDRGTDCGN